MNHFSLREIIKIELSNISNLIIQMSHSMMTRSKKSQIHTSLEEIENAQLLLQLNKLKKEYSRLKLKNAQLEIKIKRNNSYSPSLSACNL